MLLLCIPINHYGINTLLTRSYYVNPYVLLILCNHYLTFNNHYLTLSNHYLTTKNHYLITKKIILSPTSNNFIPYFIPYKKGIRWYITDTPDLWFLENTSHTGRSGNLWTSTNRNIYGEGVVQSDPKRAVVDWYEPINPKR